MLSERARYSVRISGVIAGVLLIITTILCYVAGYNPMLRQTGRDTFTQNTPGFSGQKKMTQNIDLYIRSLSPSAVLPTGPNVLNVKSFGARGDGETDDTAAIQRMIDETPDSGGELVIPAGIYLVDAVRAIRLKNNIVLHMGSDTVIKAIPNSATHYSVLEIADVQNVKIIGGTILGERREHKGSRGEWGMGIRITGSNNVTVQGTIVKDCWGDGVYIGTGATGKPSENISLSDVHADNNRRQGITLISGRNVSIIRPRLTNTNGTPPSAGLSIEPNRITETIDNVEVVDAYTAGNAEGIAIALKKLNGTSVPVRIHIRNHRDEGSGRGLAITSSDAIVPGTLTVSDSVWSNSKKNGLSIQNHDYKSFAIEIVRPQIIDANRSGVSNANTGSAIGIYHFTGRKGIIGNVTIRNPVIYDSGEVPKTLSAFYISNSMDQEILNLSIIDPEIGGSIPRDIPAKLRKYVSFTQ